MKTKIKKVHDYFRNKLINGDFEVKKIKKHHILLIIDNEYLFIIWSANEGYGLQTTECLMDLPQRYLYSFMDINFRESDKKTLWDKLKPILKKHNDTVILIEKERQFEQLKKELNK